MAIRRKRAFLQRRPAVPRMECRRFPGTGLLPPRERSARARDERGMKQPAGVNSRRVSTFS